MCSFTNGYREHNMIRFQNGEPQALWYSQHSGGQAFTYGALEKQGKRPYAYSANGTHAVYSIAGFVPCYGSKNIGVNVYSGTTTTPFPISTSL